MDLGAAMRIMTRTAHVSGTSDGTTTALAAGHLVRGVASEVPLLDRGVSFPPIHLLLHLAYATRFAYERTVLDAYQQWALFRYIGAFDHERGIRGIPHLRLSEAGRKVAGNQRRVFSEDIGIGMSSVLAREWAAATFGSGPMHLIDLDVAIQAGVLRGGQGKRADYLIVEIDGHGGLVLHGLLESKGSNSVPYTRTQLTNGAKQIEATWRRTAPELPGLVVATCAGRRGVDYLAARIDPPQRSGRPTLLSDSPAAASLLAGTWAKLADIADDDSLYVQVAPPALKSRRGRIRPRSRPSEVRNVNGREFEGSSIAIPLPGGQLQLFLGADRTVLTELRRGRIPEAISALESSGRGARSRREATLEVSRYEPWDQDPPEASRSIEATSEDGVAISLDVTG